MDGVVEIISFTQPNDNDKNLYIAKISKHFNDADLQETLYDRFSPYGLIYEVQVVAAGPTWQHDKQTVQPGSNSSKAQKASSVAGQLTREDDVDGHGYYAFVKFYSTADASRALKELSGRLYMKGQHAQVKLAKRKIASAPRPLHFNKCYSLANHYLGFNGWQSSIIALKADVLDEAPSGEQSVGYFCVVRIELGQELCADGVGIAQQNWSLAEPSGRCAAVCRAKKRAHQRATENAFGKVLLVILSSGKVYVEVNTTLEEELHHNEGLDLDAMLTVTDQTAAPPGETDDLDDVDLVNCRILEELVACSDEC